MVFTVCPFCGVASEDAHDSQEACIAALHAEIEKARQLLASADGACDGSPPPYGDKEEDAHQV